jgi:ribonuclease HI
MENETLEIYVDASVRNHKACIVGKVKEILPTGEEIFRELFYQDIYTDKSSKVEILACARSLKEADKQNLVFNKKKVVIYSDFQDVVEGYRSLAYLVGRGLSLKGRELVVDFSEWKELAKQREYYFQKYKIQIDIKKIKAHHTDKYNNSVDAMAKEIVRQPEYLFPKETQILTPRKSNKASIQINQVRGILDLFGQRVYIKIRNREYFAKKIWICKYEFFSTQSSSWLRSEHKIFTRLSLEEEKTYLAKVEMNKKQPWIIEALEIENEKFSQIT